MSTKQMPANTAEITIDLIGTIGKIEKTLTDTDKVKCIMFSDYLAKYPNTAITNDYKDFPISMTITMPDEGKIIKSIGIYFDSQSEQIKIYNAFGLTLKGSIEKLYLATTNQLSSYGLVKIDGISNVTLKIPCYTSNFNVIDYFPNTSDDTDYIEITDLSKQKDLDFIRQSKPIAIYPYQLKESIDYEITRNYKFNFEYYLQVKGENINMVIKPDRQLLSAYLNDKINKFRIISKYQQTKKKDDKDMTLTLCNYDFS